MFGALIIVFREVMEAGIIVGIAMVVTRGVARRGQWVGAGVAAGAVAAGIVAVFIGAISSAFAGVGQDLFNATILAIAVCMLAWHNVWMARHGRDLSTRMRAAGAAVAAGTASMVGLAIVVAIAVLREGSEVALFLYGIAVASEPGSGASLLAGGLLGLAAGAALTFVTYRGLAQIPGRYLFGVTSTLIAFLAGGLASQSVAFLQQAGIATALGATVWDTSRTLSDSTIFGRALHTLVGYSDRPTALQLVVYLATLGLIFCLMKVAAPSRTPPAAVQNPATG